MTVETIRKANVEQMRRAAERREQMVELFGHGHSIDAIALKLDVAVETVRRGLRREGIEPPRRHVARPWTEADTAIAKPLLDDGASYFEVARTIGRDFYTVVRNMPGYPMCDKAETARRAALGRAMSRLERELRPPVG
ncbi:helix-turn-helix DNA binding domain protein [Mycobacterium phage Thonko]|uniref:Helix-turn-helix DNA binding domain protein n=1 Tax=Mycobacterium phage Thonko TaxID=2282910 RepID=A0A346FCD1_9CAUD|nr:helix-turn-helix DNA binding domain protein [Mycobacterium phage Thonko]AXN53356.1 helix-turn-helix DNA binding domain protein [Mycobacterium phage Thonko]